MKIGEPAFGGIDAGGTTFKCGIADLNGNLVDRKRFLVTTPEETLAQCVQFFRDVANKHDLQSFGIASFGPLDVAPDSETYGTILTTPKPGWKNTDLRGYFSSALGIPVGIDTDVNGALLAEMLRGAAIGADSAAYITIGTGIGAGIISGGSFLGRPSHPEFGHISVRRHPNDLAHKSVCPFHTDCLEGFASVTAMRARWGEPKDLPEDHEGWDIIADYLAQACRTLTLTLRLERIVLGGGLMLAPHLLGRVRRAYDVQMGVYFGDQMIDGEVLIDRPGLGDDAGLIGAILLGISKQNAQGREHELSKK